MNESAIRSTGSPSKGRLLGAALFADSPSARILPNRHVARCLRYATPRLIQALEHAASRVQVLIPGSPPLGVGDLSRANGGSIAPYSRSHQSGRDADLAFYAQDFDGQPVAASDLIPFSDALEASEGSLHIDVQRNWQLVAALLEDSSVDIEWLFIAPAIGNALLIEGSRQGASREFLARARAILHQPSDAPPHNDHLHLRIRCTEEEKRAGCVD